MVPTESYPDPVQSTSLREVPQHKASNALLTQPELPQSSAIIVTASTPLEIRNSCRFTARGACGGVADDLHRGEFGSDPAARLWFYQVLTSSQWLQVCQDDGWSIARDAAGRSTLRVNEDYAIKYAKNWIQPFYGIAVVARFQLDPTLFDFPEPRSIHGAKELCFDILGADTAQLLRAMTSPLRQHLVIGTLAHDRAKTDIKRPAPPVGMVDDVAALLNL